MAHFEDIEDFNQIVISPGRFNPPHRGHKVMIDNLVELGKELNAEPVVLIIDSGKRNEKNPLSGETRKRYLQKMFPRVRFEIFKNPYEAVFTLADQNKEVPVGGVAGADRGNAYKQMVGRIFGDDVKEKYVSKILYRDPDATDDVAGASATKARQAAKNNDVEKFRALTGLNASEAKKLMDELVKGMSEQ